MSISTLAQIDRWYLDDDDDDDDGGDILEAAWGVLRFKMCTTKPSRTRNEAESTKGRASAKESKQRKQRSRGVLLQ